MLIECIQVNYGSCWKKGEVYEAIVLSDSNSKFIETADGKVMRFFNYDKDERGLFNNDHLNEEIIKGIEATFRIIE